MLDQDLELLSNQITNWKSLARRLLFLNTEIIVYLKKNQELNEKILAMLIYWKVSQGSAATYRVLYDALRHPLVNRRDLAYKLCTDASSSLVST